MKQRRIKKMVKQRLNASDDGAPLFASKADKLAEMKRIKEEINEDELISILLDPDQDSLATDEQSQKEAAKAGITAGSAAGEILQGEDETEEAQDTKPLDFDSDGDGLDDGAEVVGGTDPNDGDDPPPAP